VLTPLARLQFQFKPWALWQDSDSELLIEQTEEFEEALQTKIQWARIRFAGLVSPAAPTCFHSAPAPKELCFNTSLTFDVQPPRSHFHILKRPHGIGGERPAFDALGVNLARLGLGMAVDCHDLML